MLFPARRASSQSRPSLAPGPEPDDGDSGVKIAAVAEQLVHEVGRDTTKLVPHGRCRSRMTQLTHMRGNGNDRL